MLPLDHPDRIQIAFDDHRLVANAGLLLPLTLARTRGDRPAHARRATTAEPVPPAQVGSRHNIRVGIRVPADYQSRPSARAGAQTQDQEDGRTKSNAHSGP